MTAEPTDLIREASAYVQPNPQFRSLYAPGADLVRRLRDALEAERNAAKQARDLCEHHHAGIATYADGLVTELGETKAALAEANATIERVRALADQLGHCTCDPSPWGDHREGCSTYDALVIRRAIEGPMPEVFVVTGARGWVALAGVVTEGEW